ncbi:hypothetical protein GCM10011360_30390 [Primorskyibacter flagellatus]|uniref:Polyketide cyclase / dehydrase and lipid transport n=1 Tax=Primorskyibacter flagellatus TaxID=1387277 RepID=A0A917ACF3_9RHOB|nr:hypothetical protein [Primorskyibacter flagellatus]GGE40759.1 hypothetical protein GCM10011360_30390 [Primorskyibacter flagellatus]
MAGTVRVASDYATSPDALWALTKDLDALVEMNARMVTMTGMPHGDMVPGQVIEAQVSLFGRLPPQPYRIDILTVDDASRTFTSAEHGSGVKSWNHTATVTETAQGARLTDVIEIDAGWKTPLVLFWANRLYRARHAPRLRLLDQRGQLR